MLPVVATRQGSFSGLPLICEYVPILVIAIVNLLQVYLFVFRVVCFFLPASEPFLPASLSYRCELECSPKLSNHQNFH